MFNMRDDQLLLKAMVLTPVLVIAFLDPFLWLNEYVMACYLKYAFLQVTAMYVKHLKDSSIS